jgi:ribonuclease HI
MTIELKKVTIYTDGACKGNPGPGGYGSVLSYGKHRSELSGGFAKTTNNRMEIIAAVKAFEKLKFPCEVELYSDSKYLVNAMTEGWALRWRANGWMRNNKESAQNHDLWKRLLELCEIHRTKFIWVKGHAANEENNRCDQLAVAAAMNTDLPPDNGYNEPQANDSDSLFQSE